jgi:hypothetical protein
MDQPIDRGRGSHRIFENAFPFREWQVARQQHAAAFIALRQQREDCAAKEYAKAPGVERAGILGVTASGLITSSAGAVARVQPNTFHGLK